MNTILKKITLGILTIIMVFTVLPTAAFAAEDVFEPRLSTPSGSNPYYNRTLNVYAKQGYGMPNCTAYAYGRIYEITGEAPLINSGNAGDWWFINKRNDYYEYGSEPKIGAIACWNSHVSVVEEIDGDTVTTSESHWGGKYFNTQVYDNPNHTYRQTFYGYIYASDAVFAEEEKPVYDYTQDISEYTEIKPNPFADTEITAVECEPALLMNSPMLTNAVG
ncbi:MAG: CHAP domain-containing protein [Eubacterium sp.]|nr:CHAP domain-containing protein [Eubacterium sp.]